ncbi:MAG: hypothetical protein JNK03_02315, partial [Nitrospira sp.]|nr:hypothetical protein [Nitrospira sp.]
MLPSLTVSVLIGLVCGAQVTFFPLSVLTALLTIAVALTLIERTGHLTTGSALALYLGVLSGAIYWSITTTPPSHHPSPEILSIEESIVIGRVIVPVQHGANRQTLVLQT